MLENKVDEINTTIPLSLLCETELLVAVLPYQEVYLGSGNPLSSDHLAKPPKENDNILITKEISNQT